VGGWPNHGGLIEAGNQDAEKVGSIGRRRGVPLVDRGAAGRAREADPVVGRREALRLPIGKAEVSRGGVGPGDGGRAAEPLADRAMAISLHPWRSSISNRPRRSSIRHSEQLPSDLRHSPCRPTAPALRFPARRRRCPKRPGFDARHQRSAETRRCQLSYCEVSVGGQTAHGPTADGRCSR